MFNSPRETTKRARLVSAAIGLVIAGVMMMGLPDRATAQKLFATPDAASKTLLDALKNDDDAALLDIFGREIEELMDSTDKVERHANRMRFYRAAREFLIWRISKTGIRTLVIGDKAWPMPIPLIKAGAGWRFDTPAGIDEIVNRRIGRNELSAIDVCVAYVNAQKQFASRDRDGDKVREYARKIRSPKGTRDGLYWEAKAGEEISPFGPLVAEQRDYYEGLQIGDPFKGYYFKILTRQGGKAPGGRYDYVINGNMIAGFAMVAFPADYGTAGIMSFIVSHHGVVYQKDLGAESPLLGRALQVFNPDKTWEPVKR
jgi:hypothetical protein